MGSGGQKRIALGGNKESFVRIKGFLYVKRRFLRTVKSCSNERYIGCKNERLLRGKRKAFCKWKTFGLRKRQTFSQRTAATTSHCTKANVQFQIISAKTYCELAVQHSFFEQYQSCVCTTVTLSHRFKSSPAIPGKLAVPDAAGYMMNAGHFRKSYVSSGDLNRPWESRGSQPSISLKHGRLAHVRSQFSLFRRSPTHKNLPPATFCTSERVFAVLFARRKK